MELVVFGGSEIVVVVGTVGYFVAVLAVVGTSVVVVLWSCLLYTSRCV